MIANTPEIALNFIKLLKKSEIQPQEVAFLLGVSVSTIYTLYNGKRSTSQKMYLLIRLYSKFLSWALAKEKLPLPKEVGKRTQEINNLFESWFCKE